MLGLGLDLEYDTPLDGEQIVNLICRPDELGSAVNDSSRHHGKLLFVIKEAVYKLHSAGGGQFLDFHDVRVAVDRITETFRAEVLSVELAGDAGTSICGAYRRSGGLFMALALQAKRSSR
jgi:4'-phosphopantetheinyl transferase EntD